MVYKFITSIFFISAFACNYNQQKKHMLTAYFNNLKYNRKGLKELGKWDSEPQEYFQKGWTYNENSSKIIEWKICADEKTLVNNVDNFPEQKNFNSCVINSVGRGLNLLKCDLNEKNYIEYFEQMALWGGALYEHKDEADNTKIPEDKIKFQIVKDYIIGQYFIKSGLYLKKFCNSPCFYLIQNYSDSKYSVKYYMSKHFSEVISTIKNAINNKRPIVGRFFLDYYNKKERWHAMTFIGFFKTCFLILNTQPFSYKEEEETKKIFIGRFLYSDLKNCMNDDGRYRLIKFINIE